MTKSNMEKLRKMAEQHGMNLDDFLKAQSGEYLECPSLIREITFKLRK